MDLSNIDPERLAEQIWATDQANGRLRSPASAYAVARYLLEALRGENAITREKAKAMLRYYLGLPPCDRAE